MSRKRCFFIRYLLCPNEGLVTGTDGSVLVFVFVFVFVCLSCIGSRGFWWWEHFHRTVREGSEAHRGPNPRRRHRYVLSGSWHVPVGHSRKKKKLFNLEPKVQRFSNRIVSNGVEDLQLSSWRSFWRSAEYSRAVMVAKFATGLLTFVDFCPRCVMLSSATRVITPCTSSRHRRDSGTDV